MADFRIGTNEIKAAYIGTTPIKKVYLGSNLLKDYSTAPPVAIDFKSALNFDGIMYGNIPAVVQYNEWTLSYWFRNEGSKIGIILGDNAATSYAGYVSGVGRITCRLNGSNAFDFAALDNYDGNWHHVYTEKKATHEMRCFKDGIESIDGTLALATSSFDPIFIGKRNGTLPYFGDLDDVIFEGNYTASDPAANALAIYNSGLGADASSFFGTPKFYYHLDGEGTEKTLVDSGGLGNHATLVNTPEQSFWTKHDFDVDAQTVISRMTTPSNSFRLGIDEYVIQEKAATNDNWDLTDDVSMLNVDTEVNALIGWKQMTLTKAGTITDLSFIAYKGVTWADADTSKRLETNANPSVDALNFNFADSFTTIGHEAISGLGTIRYFLALGVNINAPRIYQYISGTERIFATINNIAVVGSDDSTGWIQNNDIITMLQVGTNSYQYRNTTQIGSSILAATAIKAGVFKLGASEANSTTWGHAGTLNAFAYGGGVGFDRSSHYSAQRKFADRMLIQKHATVVNLVLSRYTDLTDREVLALSRYVARQEEKGDWSKTDEVFPLGLYSAANAKIGMKSFSMTLEEGTETHLPGIGFDFDNLTAFDTGFVIGTGVAANIDGQMGSIGVNDDTPVNHSTMGTSNGFKLDFRDTGARMQWANTFTGGTVTDHTKLQKPYTLAQACHNGTSWYTFLNGVQDDTGVRGSDATDTESLRIGCRRLGAANGSFWLGQLSFNFISQYIGFDQTYHYTNAIQMVNELEIGQATTVDYDVQDATYSWDNREVAPDQLDELAAIIVANSDNTTTGRTLDIQSNLGITLKCQISLDQLVTNGWIVLQ